MISKVKPKEVVPMGSTRRWSEDQMRVLRTYVKLRRTVNCLRQREDEILRAAGLTESQFGVLEALLHLGPMCLKELAVKILKSPGNLTTVIDNLERRELVERRRRDEDRRVVTVHITGRGERLIRSVFPGHLESLVGAFSVLSPAEQDQLGELCRRLGTAGEG
jgi:MarR family 2-MHQ and catechol resistance regulon transcriptional repressor